MKNIIYMGWLLAMFAYLFTACSPQEFDDYSTGAAPTESDVSFTIKPVDNETNIIEFKNTSSRVGLSNWSFDGGKTVENGESIIKEYPFAGTYGVIFTFATVDGSISITREVIIENDDLALLAHPLYTALTGGADKAEGKTWVFDQYKKGHLGVGPAGAPTPEWWAAGPNEKLDCSLYDQEYTFKQVGVEMIWKNEGQVYTNEEGKAKLLSDGFGPATVPPAGDFDVEYTPKDKYTFSLNTQDSTLTISDGGFLGFYAGTSEFKILSIDDEYMTIRANSAVKASDAWFARFVVKELNVEPEKEPVETKEIPLSEDFEKEESTIEFAMEEMGELTSHSYSNPAPVPINKSSKVYLYEKKAGVPYSNISFVASGYNFDLTDQNTIKMKVYIPSYNDYTTENDVAGDHVANKVLQQSIAVKLQNNDLGGNAWETQTEILMTGLEMDKWLELEFDFSGVASREDYNKIVIQFGTEGHNGEIGRAHV